MSVHIWQNLPCYVIKSYAVFCVPFIPQEEYYSEMGPKISHVGKINQPLCESKQNPVPSWDLSEV